MAETIMSIYKLKTTIAKKLSVIFNDLSQQKPWPELNFVSDVLITEMKYLTLTMWFEKNWLPKGVVLLGGVALLEEACHHGSGV